MPFVKVKDKYTVFKGTKKYEIEYKKELSAILISEFGSAKGKPQDVIRKMLVRSLEYFAEKFQLIINWELSLDFYRNVLSLHEDAIVLAYFVDENDLESKLPENYLSGYRRVLKMVLEEAIEINMKVITFDSNPEHLLPRLEQKLDKLLFIGNMIITCTEFFAEQDMIEDVSEIEFDDDGLFVFGRRHHYNEVLEQIQKLRGDNVTKSLVDDRKLESFVAALSDCFAIDFKHTGRILAELHNELEPEMGHCPLFPWELLPTKLNQLFGYSLEICEQYYRGLTLDKANKMDLLTLIQKPYKLNRYLYRPILIWTIEGFELAIVGTNIWFESIRQLHINAIPWGKAPEEWMKNRCFKKYVHTREDEHDGWLDNEVESILMKTNVFYDRNVKSLSNASGQSVSIDVSGLGEVDFLVVAPHLQKFFVTECKHLVSRYDMVNQKNDFNAFTKGPKKKKSYNDTAKAKLEWFQSNLPLLQDHFRKIASDPSLDMFGFTVEAIFIVNTPTFYMYNAEYRIYTVAEIAKVFSGEFVDTSFHLLIDEEDREVNYPYFQKPKYVLFDQFSDENEEV